MAGCCIARAFDGAGAARSPIATTTPPVMTPLIHAETGPALLMLAPQINDRGSHLAGAPVRIPDQKAEAMTLGGHPGGGNPLGEIGPALPGKKLPRGLRILERPSPIG